MPSPGVFNDAVWSVQERRFVSFDELLQQVRRTELVLLGETHDNLDHHAIQDRIVRASADPAQRAVLVMEQFDLEQQDSLNTIMASSQSDTAKLAAFKDLMKPGWDWDGYRPLLTTALHLQIPIVAANISRSALRDVARTGFGVLGAGEEKRLGLSDAWSAAQQAQIGKRIADSHCGMLPATAVAGMSNAQRARDAIMADRMLSLPTGRAFAILGREHVRKDLGVPLYLQRRAPETTVLSIGLIEIADRSILEKFHRTYPDEPYDYIVMAKAVERPDDPCEGMILPRNNSAP